MTPTPASNLSDDPGYEARKAALDANSRVVGGYLSDYEWDDGENCPYIPSDIERGMIEDAVQGLLADAEFVSTFNAWQDLCRLDRARATAEPVAMHRWFDAMTKDRCDCVFETALVTRWIDELLTGKAYIPGLGATVAPSPAPELPPQQRLDPKMLADMHEHAFNELYDEGAALAVGTEIPQKQPPATDRNVAVGSTRFSDGKIQTKASLADEIRKSMLAAADEAIAANADHQAEAPIQLPDVGGTV